MISRCPQCGREVAIPPGVSAEAKVRCPICAAEYPLADALSQLPPLLIVVDPLFAQAEGDSPEAVSAVQSAATAEEAAWLTQPAAASAEPSDTASAADLFTPPETQSDRADVESEEHPVAGWLESGDALATEQAESDYQSGEFAVADEDAAGGAEATAEAETEAVESEVSEESAEQAALAEFARAQEAKPEPSAAAKLRRKKGRNPVWQLVGIVGGAVLGLLMGYYVLNFFWGPQHDYLGIYLPGCPHTYKHLPTWLGGKSSGDENGSSKADAKKGGKNSKTAARSKSQQAPNGNGTSDAPTVPSAGDDQRAQSSDNVAPQQSVDGMPPPTTATNDATPVDETPSGGALDAPGLMSGETAKPLPSDEPSPRRPGVAPSSFDAPGADAPGIDMPALDIPKLDIPKLEIPKADLGKSETPPSDRPQTEEPTPEPSTMEPGEAEPAADGHRPGSDAPSMEMPHAAPDNGPMRPSTEDSPQFPSEPAQSVPAKLPDEALPATPMPSDTASEASSPRPQAPGTSDESAKPRVQWKNAPSVTIEQLNSAVAAAFSVFGCDRCAGKGTIEVEGHEQTCPKCGGKPPAEVNDAVYEKLSAAAAAYVHLKADDSPSAAGARAAADELFRQAARLGSTEQLGSWAARRIQTPEGPRGGIVLACVLGKEFSKDGLYGATVETLGEPHRIGIFSDRPFGVESGTKVLVLADVLVDPKENLIGAQINKPWLIWVGRVIAIEQP